MDRDHQIAADFEILDRGRIEERQAAMTRLARTADPMVAKMLAKRALDDTRSDWELSLIAEALGQLGQLGGVPAVEALTRLLPATKRKESLDRLLDEPAAPRDADNRAALRDQRYDDLATLRAAAAAALGRIGGEPAVTALVDALTDPHPSTPRRSCLVALTRIGSPSAVAAVKAHKAERRAARALR